MEETFTRSETKSELNTETLSDFLVFLFLVFTSEFFIGMTRSNLLLLPFILKIFSEPEFEP